MLPRCQIARIINKIHIYICNIHTAMILANATLVSILIRKLRTKKQVVCDNTRR